LIFPHHYLSTSGGYDIPQGESSMNVTLVILGGWEKKALCKGFKIAASAAGICLTGTSETETEDELMDDIFYHAGGRIREALQYLKDPVRWKLQKRAMINKISKGEARLSVIETKGSSDRDSVHRIRTMF
jgi:hypothetical protein